jgi:dolichol-phosphate mannosyltransferase
MRLTIVIPTFNEAENLPLLVSTLLDLPLDSVNVLVVDDSSPDGTGQIADDLAIKYPGCISAVHRKVKLGLGTAYICGFQQALAMGAEAVCQMDADFSHPPEKVVELMRTLESCDVAMGSRYVAGGNVDQDWPLWRKGLSAFGNIYARAVLRLPVRDATGGFRIWRRETLAGMPLERIRSNGYAFQIEMAYVAYRLGYKFKEVPFYFADRRRGHSKMSFRIQREAAVRVWQMVFEYRRLERSL